MATSLQQELIDRGHALREEYAELLEVRAANRRTLRDLLAQGLLTESQAVAVEELYPERAPRGSRAAESE